MKKLGPMKFYANKLHQMCGLGVEVYWSFGQIHCDVYLLLWAVGGTFFARSEPDAESL